MKLLFLLINYYYTTEHLVIETSNSYIYKELVFNSCCEKACIDYRQNCYYLFMKIECKDSVITTFNKYEEL